MALPDTELEDCICYLFKYYPGPTLKSYSPQGIQESIDRFTCEHGHTNDGSHFCLIFDSWFSKMAKARNEILDVVGSLVREQAEKYPNEGGAP